MKLIVKKFRNLLIIKVIKVESGLAVHLHIR